MNRILNTSQQKLQYLFLLFLSLLAKSILLILGWRVNPSADFDYIRNKKIIILFPHTTKFDFVLTILFYFANFRSELDPYVIVKPQIIEKFSFLEKFNFVSATRREDSNRSFIKTMTNHFKDKNEFSIFMSPKGTVAKAEWKTGFYWLATQIDANFVVMGLDYLSHNIKMYPLIPRTNLTGELKSMQQIKEEALVCMNEVHPMNPNTEENVPDDRAGTYFDYPTFTVLSAIIPIVLIYRHVSIFYTFTCICGLISALLYHQHKETCELYRLFDIGFGVLNTLLYIYYIVTTKLLNDEFFVLYIYTSYLTYFLASGREQNNIRDNKYVVYHSMFHILSVATLTYGILHSR